MTRGFTLLEVIIVVAVLGILLTFVVPQTLCVLDKSKATSRLEDLSSAQRQVEIFEAEQGRWPISLAEAFGGEQLVPEGIVYCTDDLDANAGHGNEYCSFFDSGNPSGQNQHGGLPDMGYMLLTEGDDLSRCMELQAAWLFCCGMEPNLVTYDDDLGDIPGHPGKPHGTP